MKNGSFLVLFIAVLAFVGVVSAAGISSPIYNTGAGCMGSGGIAWHSHNGGDYTEWVSGYAVLPNTNVSTPTTTGSAWIGSRMIPNGADSCSACGVTVSCTNVNTFIGYNDTNNPNVYSVFPLAGTSVFYPANIQIGMNASDDISINSTYMNITRPDGVSNLYNLSSSSGLYLYNYAVPGIFGRYNVSFFAVDQNGNVNNTEKTYFIVNNASIIVPPVLPNGTNVTNSTTTPTGNYSQNWIAINLSLPASGAPYNATIYLINLGTGVTQVVYVYGNPIYYVFNNLSSGTYLWYAIINNTFGSSTTTGNTTIVLDTIAPIVYMNFTQNIIYTSIPVNFSLSSNEPAFCFYSLDSGALNSCTMINQTSFNFSVSPVNGNHNVTIYVSDYVGNTNRTFLNFSVNVAGNNGGGGGGGGSTTYYDSHNDNKNGYNQLPADYDVNFKAIDTGATILSADHSMVYGFYFWASVIFFIGIIVLIILIWLLVSSNA